MGKKSRKAGDGVSLAKGPVALLGALMLAFGIVAFLLGGDSFSTSAPSGDVSGDTLLGIEGNGWTNLLWAVGGALLLFGSPFHWGAKTTALIVGLSLGAASVIAMLDGFADGDVLGVLATNARTMLALGVASALLLLSALLPRVGRGKEKAHAPEHDRDRHDADRHRHDADRDRHDAAAEERAPATDERTATGEESAGAHDSAMSREQGGRFERTGEGTHDPQVAAARDAEQGRRE